MMPDQATAGVPISGQRGDAGELTRRPRGQIQVEAWQRGLPVPADADNRAPARRVYPGTQGWDILRAGKEANMAKTIIDVDEDYLAAAQQVLHTQTKKDTVNAALREVAALAARRRDLQRLTSGGLPDPPDNPVIPPPCH